MAHHLSNRAQEMLKKRDPLDHYNMLCLHDSYNPVSNKKGYVNLGTSVSSLCEDIVVKRMNEPSLFQFISKDQHYYSMWGIPDFRRAIASCLTRQLSPNNLVHEDNVLVVNGGVAAMEVLACCLFDPGDVLLTPSPCYTRIFVNFNERFKVDVKDVFLKCGDGVTFELTPEILEESIKEHTGKGNKVKGFFLVNPNNPLGEVYSSELVLKLVSVCNRYNMHFISDEAYAMSIYEPETKFQSILSLHSKLPDPQKTHVIWAFSKDVNLAGMRIGALVTWNEDLLRVVKNTSMYTAVPAIAQQAAARLLNDTVWLDEVLLPTHRNRLYEAAKKTREALNSIGITIRQAQAGFFFWVDLRPFMQERTNEEEIALFKLLMEHKVYITPGSEMRCTEPGWFRIVFSAKPEILDEGLRRIVEALKQVKIK